MLFRLQEGEIGGPVETELGFHLILCERIRSARTQPFAKAREQIRAVLEERRRLSCQRAWIAELRAGAAGSAEGQSSVGIQAGDVAET